MSNEKTMVCIVCPMSCQLEITLDETGKVQSVAGNSCRRGEIYVRNEFTNPRRMLTSTVSIEGAVYSRLPVVTSEEIPKEMIFPVMEEIKKIRVCAPVEIGAIIVKNVCGLSADILASRSMSKCE